MRFIEIYAGRKVYFQEKVGTRTYWVFEGFGKYPYVTVTSTKCGNKEGTIYSWLDLDEAINYQKRAVEKQKQRLINKKELKEQNKEKSVEVFNKINVGDIYVTTWGYEACWYEFYKVVDKKNGWVYLQKLRKVYDFENLNNGWASHGKVSPREEADGEIFRRRVNQCGFGGLASYEFCARKYDPQADYEEANWH